MSTCLRRNNMDKSFSAVKLQTIIETIQGIDASFDTGGVCSQFLELKSKNNEVVISGNFEGLVHLAMKVLEVAASCKEGTHAHFDADSMLDECDSPLVINYKNAEWD